MNALPAELLDRTAADEHPATLDLDQPCPDDVCAAVVALWQITREIKHRLDKLDRLGF
jgi:hypothetical protein